MLRINATVDKVDVQPSYVVVNLTATKPDISSANGKIFSAVVQLVIQDTVSPLNLGDVIPFTVDDGTGIASLVPDIDTSSADAFISTSAAAHRAQAEFNLANGIDSSAPAPVELVPAPVQVVPAPVEVVPAPVTGSVIPGVTSPVSLL